MRRVDWRKVFRLPSPKDLGWTDSESSALPMRTFQAVSDDTHTWEDWEERMRKEHPIKYFMAESVPLWFLVSWRRYVHDPIYWVKCHTLPSYHFHVLSLRQPKTEYDPGYSYGWIDSDTKITFALFNILNTFVKDEMPNWYCPSEEEVQSDPSLLHQRNNWLETKAIHYWWNVERPRQQKAHADMLSEWYDAKQAHDPKEHQLWDDMKKAEKALEDKEEEMIGRLIKIRHALWT